MSSMGMGIDMGIAAGLVLGAAAMGAAGAGRRDCV